MTEVNPKSLYYYIGVCDRQRIREGKYKIFLEEILSVGSLMDKVWPTSFLVRSVFLLPG